jgi:hypothetical protein
MKISVLMERGRPFPPRRRFHDVILPIVEVETLPQCQFVHREQDLRPFGGFVPARRCEWVANMDVDGASMCIHHANEMAIAEVIREVSE